MTKALIIALICTSISQVSLAIIQIISLIKDYKSFLNKCEHSEYHTFSS